MLVWGLIAPVVVLVVGMFVGLWVMIATAFAVSTEGILTKGIAMVPFVVFCGLFAATMWLAVLPGRAGLKGFTEPSPPLQMASLQRRFWRHTVVLLGCCGTLTGLTGAAVLWSARHV